jgi:hypothetical protein
MLNFWRVIFADGAPKAFVEMILKLMNPVSLKL